MHVWEGDDPNKIEAMIEDGDVVKKIGVKITRVWQEQVKQRLEKWKERSY